MPSKQVNMRGTEIKWFMPGQMCRKQQSQDWLPGTKPILLTPKLPGNYVEDGF